MARKHIITEDSIATREETSDDLPDYVREAFADCLPPGVRDRPQGSPGQSGLAFVPRSVKSWVYLWSSRVAH